LTPLSPLFFPFLFEFVPFPVPPASCPLPALTQLRRTGKLLTTAQWLRQLIMSHKAYKHDSNISEELNYYIIETCNKISRLEIGVT
jgi:hypothetical protein